MQSDNNEKDEQASKEPAKTGAAIANPTSAADERAREKAKLQAALKALVVQLKQGCKKNFCFNQFCRKNYLGKLARKSSVDRLSLGLIPVHQQTPSTLTAPFCASVCRTGEPALQQRQGDAAVRNDDFAVERVPAREAHLLRYQGAQSG